MSADEEIDISYQGRRVKCWRPREITISDSPKRILTMQ